MARFGEKLDTLRKASPWCHYFLNYDSLKEVLEKLPKDNKRSRTLSWASISSYQMNYDDSGDGTMISPTNALSMRLDKIQVDNELPSILNSMANADVLSRLHPVTVRFLQLVEAEVEKVVLFILKQQGEVAKEISEARDLFRELSGKTDFHGASYGSSTSELLAEAQLQDIDNRLYEVGIHLLRLIQFTDINLQALRKILKKHDKVVPLYKMSASFLKIIDHRQRQDNHGGRHSLVKISAAISFATKRSNELIQPLLHDDIFGALVAALHYSSHEASRHRHDVMVPASETNDFINNTIEASDRTSTALGLKRSVSTGSLWPISVVDNKVESMNYRISAITSPLSTAWKHPLASTSSEHGILTKSELVLLQLHAARARLLKTNTITSFLATEFDVRFPKFDEDEGNLVNYPSDEGRIGAQHHEEIINVLWKNQDGAIVRTTRQKISDYLNLLSTFLYMTNYYIVAPTSASYAWKLGGTASLSSMIIGMTPAAAMVSTILYSWWTSKSYKPALIFASTCSMIGNFLYAIALPRNSITMVMVGRLLNGLGSARCINRRYIADVFSKEQRTGAAAVFVMAGALGMAAGPAIASILNELTEDSQSLYWQSENSPGTFMFLSWATYLMCLILFFDDPKKSIQSETTPSKINPRQTEKTPLLGTTFSNGTTTVPLAFIENGRVSLDEGTSTGTVPTRIPAIMNLLIFFVIKLCQEAVLSSTPLLTGFYFRWTGTMMGIYLSILGFLMLPVNILVAYLAQRHNDRELIVVMMIAVVVGCVATVHFFQDSTEYTLVQYVTGSVIVIVSATSLEGPSMSLLSKTIPRSWRTGIFNVGLLATEAGTFGRVIADIIISIAGAGGLQHLLNRIFGSFAIATSACLLLILHFYDFMEPFEDDD